MFFNGYMRSMEEKALTAGRADPSDHVPSPRYARDKFTGQRAETRLGPSGGERLYYYGSRWYDPALGRFAAADRINPDQNNVQAWDMIA
jgi:RHS repeat-associated protein